MSIGKKSAQSSSNSNVFIVGPIVATPSSKERCHVIQVQRSELILLTLCKCNGYSSCFVNLCACLSVTMKSATYLINTLKQGVLAFFYVLSWLYRGSGSC